MSRSFDDQLSDAINALFEPKRGPTANGKAIDFDRLEFLDKKTVEEQVRSFEQDMKQISAVQDAAPDLLTACKVAFLYLNEERRGKHVREILAAAITKAKGK
jgi:hypothetical protein